MKNVNSEEQGKMLEKRHQLFFFQPNSMKCQLL